MPHKKPHSEHIVFDTMGTTVHATLCDVTADTAARYEKDLVKVFEQWNRVFSRFREDSELMMVNRAAGHWVDVSALFFDVFVYCLRLARQTNGAFDPSVGAYLAAAGYGLPHNYQLPRRVPTYKDLQIDTQRRRVRLAPYQVLEPAAIVKGMAMDAAAKSLRTIKSWMLNVGGDTLTRGSFGAAPWIVGIQDPQEVAAIVVAVAIHDQALATSGNYAVRWQHDGSSWHHQIAMSHGKPTRGIQSVSVVAPTATLADEFTSIAFLLGKAHGMRYLDDQGVPYLMVDEERQMHRNHLFDALTVPIDQVFDF